MFATEPCMQCGRLEQPGKPHLLTIINDIAKPLARIDNEREIGLSEWLKDENDDPQARFLCPSCLSPEQRVVGNVTE